MASQDDKKLEKFEPENDNRGWTRNLGHMVFVTTVSILIINVIVSSVNQTALKNHNLPPSAAPPRSFLAWKILKICWQLKCLPICQLIPLKEQWIAM
jgi:hypothetical protein